MIKTVELTGSEAKVEGLGGQNVAVKNLGAGTIYASIFPDIVADADNVSEIPAGGGEVVLDARGMVYLLGTGKVQCTGTPYATPNFKLPSLSESGGGGGTGDVTKAYVDAQDSTNLGTAKAYTDTAINAVNDDVTANSDSISALQSDLSTAQSDIAANTAAITDAAGKADAAQTAAEAAQAAADTNAANITATATETLAAAKSYTDTKASALDARVTENETAISTLNGTGDGSVKKAVSDGIAEVVAGAPESFDTLKEISDWINDHAESAAAMNSQIATNTAAVSSLETAKADKSEIPTTLPANGGNADTVNGHTVNADVPEDAKFTDTTYSVAMPSADGLESKEDKAKLDGIEMGAQVNTVTGVKGSAESSYRTGDINLTAEDIGAAESSHYHSTADITSGVLPIDRGGTGSATGRVKAGQPSGAAVNRDSTSEGRRTIASGDVSHAQGKCCAATGGTAHAQGYGTLASAANSTSCGGGTVADQANQVVIGTHNKTEVGRSPFVIGWGSAASDRQSVPETVLPDTPEAYSNYLRTGNTPKNIFRIDATGAAYGVGAFNTSGADYAEYIKPWFDNNVDNEDRRGYFVTIKNGKLHKAEPNDYIVGITSGNPSVVGNGDEDWLGRWQRDEFNELVYKNIEVDDYEEQEDENGNLTAVKIGSHFEKHTIEVPEYDSTQEYIERKDRPEWSCVGMIGVIPLRDDGTCVAGGFAKCGSGGIATKAEEWECHKTFFVIERVNDHIISVEMR